MSFQSYQELANIINFPYLEKGFLYMVFNFVIVIICNKFFMTIAVFLIINFYANENNNHQFYVNCHRSVL